MKTEEDMNRRAVVVDLALHNVSNLASFLLSSRILHFFCGRINLSFYYFIENTQHDRNDKLSLTTRITQSFNHITRTKEDRNEMAPLIDHYLTQHLPTSGPFPCSQLKCPK